MTQTRQMEFVVPGMHCAGCLSKVEKALNSLPQTDYARANLSTRRVRIDGSELTAETVIDTLKAKGFDAIPFEDAQTSSAVDREARQLLLALAVAGFAMMNIMLLSVSVWAGLVSDMDESTRSLFHWISAIIAIPAVAYSGQPFFKSARKALGAGTMNMDVPISLAVILATGASLLVAVRGGEHSYFDAAVMLLFFLLIGRTLDQMLRARTFSAAQTLLGLRAQTALRLDDQGNTKKIDVADVTRGMTLLVQPGMRVPVDCKVLAGQSDIDMSLVTGEAAPVRAAKHSTLYAGALNLSGALDVEATAAVEESFLSDLIRIMGEAEQSRAKMVRLADKVARIYAPCVHILAGLAFAGWLILGAGWYGALMIAVAVLIITCPCALGLAVPAVQVAAVGQLLKDGIVVKSGDALDRLANVDVAVFDKTGTLTTGAMTPIDADRIPKKALAVAQALAKHSSHPLAKSLLNIDPDLALPELTDVAEHPGEGISGLLDGQPVKLGRRAWAAPDSQAPDQTTSELTLALPDGQHTHIGFVDTPREDAKEIIGWLHAQGKRVILLSGDHPSVAQRTASALAIAEWHGGCQPADKVDVLNALSAKGERVLMVGDGINDAPALRAAHVSMSPACASDVAQVAADIVFQGAALKPVQRALTIANAADKKVKQNFALAIGYNAIAVPLALLGLVTPLIAALAMSLSSILVTGNAALVTRGKAR
ncbi:MAG: heavy metal translocating P-type ATPase [Pseudomonadota bacterium]